MTTMRSTDSRFTRRALIKAGIGTAIGGPLATNPAQAVPPFALFLGGLVLGEVVLGVLRAYGIDIGGTTEEIVRKFRNAKQFSPQIQVTHLEIDMTFIVRAGSTQSGFLQLGTSGVAAAERKRPAETPTGYWIPGELLFAATLDASSHPVGDLVEVGCGYPVSRHERSWTDKNYFKAWQQFREGLATVVVDRRRLPEIGEYSERAYSEVLLEHSWKPTPG